MVLSKLDRVMSGTGAAQAAPPGDGDFAALNLSLTHVTPVQGGTSGQCYKADIGGVPVFLKTHANIAREAAVTAAAYPQMNVRLAGSWMISPWLAPAKPAPQDVKTLIAQYSANLAGLSPVAVPPEDDISRLLAYGYQALDTLDIADGTRAALRLLFDDLNAALPGLARVMCHGDLGPKNIMAADGAFVAIDWEDAFWGVAGYDYLFWLTFFENRPHLHQYKPGGTPLGARLERAVLALIVALKCELSYRQNTHTGNAITFDARIREVLDLG